MMYTILIQGYNGIGAYRDPHELKVPVVGTKKQLDVVAKCLVSAYRQKYDFVCCVASKGDFVSNKHFDYLYADCM